MMTLFNTAINSPIIIFVTILYVITSAITTFDIRMTQAKRDGSLPPDEPALPSWISLIFWADWAFALILLLLNWKYAVVVFIIRFILKVLPVLEIAGNVIMSHFKIKK